MSIHLLYSKITKDEINWMISKWPIRLPKLPIKVSMYIPQFFLSINKLHIYAHIGTYTGYAFNYIKLPYEVWLMYVFQKWLVYKLFSIIFSPFLTAEIIYNFSTYKHKHDLMSNVVQCNSKGMKNFWILHNTKHIYFAPKHLCRQIHLSMYRY